MYTPTDLTYLPHNDADTLRVGQYSHWRSFASGDQTPTGSRDREPQSRVTGPTPRTYYPQMVINYARTLLRKTIAYAIPEPVTFDVLTDNDADATAAEQALAEALDALDAHELDVAVAIEAATIGDSAIKVTGEPGAPIMTHIDPAALTVRTHPQRPEHITHVHHAYHLHTDDYPADWPDPIGEGMTTITEIWSPDAWTVLVNAQPLFEAPNPYGWIPYVLLANERPPRSPWGQSDLIDLESICRELNRETSVLSRIMEISGWPVTVLENVAGSENIRVSPGAKWELPEGSKAYLLDLLQGGGVRLHVEYLDKLYRMIHDVSETPRTSFGDSGRALSGVALEVEIQPLVQKVRRKRAALTRFYRQRNRRLLDLLGHPDRDTRPNYAAILPSDETEEISNAINLRSAGIISHETALTRIGEEDPAGEIAQIHSERSLEVSEANDGDRQQDEATDETA